MKKSWLFIFLNSFILVLSANATEPQWWTDSRFGIYDDPMNPSDHFALVNVGQLKNVATQAKAYLDEILPSGAGSEINSLVASFTPGLDPENFAPINVGQLKNVAKPFYDRLLEVGYDTRESLILMGYPYSWPVQYQYPWDPNALAEENHAPANIGQLKLVFSFDFFRDSNGDGLSDYFKWQNGLNVVQAASGGGEDDWEYAFDNDGDGLWDVHEFEYDEKDPLENEMHLIVYGPY